MSMMIEIAETHPPTNGRKLGKVNRLGVQDAGPVGEVVHQQAAQSISQSRNVFRGSGCGGSGLPSGPTCCAGAAGGGAFCMSPAAASGGASSPLGLRPHPASASEAAKAAATAPRAANLAKVNRCDGNTTGPPDRAHHSS